MKNILTLILFSSLFVSCGKNSKYTLFESEVINYNFTIPKQYKEITPTNYLIKLIDSNEEKNLTTLNSSSVENLLNHGIPFNLLYDTSNFNNNILINEGEYIDLSTGVGSAYLGLLEESLYQNWNSLNIAYTKIQSKYVHHKQTEYLKIKYERVSNEQKNYFIQYVLSSDHRTISLVFNNKNNLDYEEIIKPIDLKKKPSKPNQGSENLPELVMKYINQIIS